MHSTGPWSVSAANTVAKERSNTVYTYLSSIHEGGPDL